MTHGPFSGASIGYQLSSVISGGPAPLIATALLAAFGSGYVIAVYIAWQCKDKLLASDLRPNFWGLGVMAVAAVQYYLGTLGAELFVSRTAFVQFRPYFWVVLRTLLPIRCLIGRNRHRESRRR